MLHRSTISRLDADILDDMPEPAAIENLMPREFDAIQSLFQVRRYAAPTPSTDFDWQHVVSTGVENQDFARFENWISRSLLEERVITARDFADMERSTTPPVSQEYVA